MNENLARLRAERDELQAAIDAAPAWGAAVGARSERLHELERAIRRLEQQEIEDHQLWVLQQQGDHLNALVRDLREAAGKYLPPNNIVQLEELIRYAFTFRASLIKLHYASLDPRTEQRMLAVGEGDDPRGIRSPDATPKSS